MSCFKHASNRTLILLRFLLSFTMCCMCALNLIFRTFFERNFYSVILFLFEEIFSKTLLLLGGIIQSVRLRSPNTFKGCLMVFRVDSNSHEFEIT